MKLKIIFCLLTCLTTYSRGQQNCPNLFTNGCYFNGTTYPVGQQLKGVCFDLTCEVDPKAGNVWYTNNLVNSSCATCSAVNDPHFITFDQHPYDWHGVCNYTLSQPKNCSTNCTYFPKYGIFGDFVVCNGGIASCVDCTTYKVSEHTVVSINHFDLSKILVNGFSVTLSSTPQLICGIPLPGDVHPLIAWIYSGCVLLQGIDFSVRACINSLHIYTTADHKYQLVGLCGYFSGIIKDDYQKRDCTTLPLTPSSNIIPFAKSWMTLQQKEDGECCPDEEGIKFSSTFTCTDGDIKIFTGLCGNAIARYKINEVERNRRIADCVNDCCRNPESCENVWIPNVQELARQVVVFGTF